MYSAKSPSLRPALGWSPPFPPCPSAPRLSSGSSLGNADFPVSHLPSLSGVKRQNDISFLLIPPRGKQCAPGSPAPSPTPDASDMQALTSLCAARRPYRVPAGDEMRPLSLSTCLPGSSVAVTRPLRRSASCLSFPGSKVITGLATSPVGHPGAGAGVAK